MPGGARHSITARIDLTKKLALSLYFVHAYDYVHKHIRPENILILPESADCKSPEHIGKPLLIHFGQVRKFTQISQRIGNPVFLREIYRHPSRQGSDVQVMHTFRHDIYSFGVVLLELALWANFADSTNRASRALFSGKPMPDGMDVLPPTPEEIQRNFVTCARRQVARTMGDVYAGVVLTCLQCVEDGLGGNESIEDTMALRSG
jgi:serine/threonine protein kinase